ncbi:glycosyltransferase [Thermodesulforhabdus norvegica]|uniref:Glycosyltransferase involved in cell wall bisynthesis n=1 Tax=Thermodesulforhabdus norvegica TaxID=39841 RepID=A0A1I4U8F8_9BACT|nr:glycosyltransferase [Thermodesulforhabdus norvegica]SFM84993.1 Glycosyltransferase involved in cell wall bisynthesis [Thermodesulforhabdus norvegica]
MAPRRILYLHASADLYGSDLLLYELTNHLDRKRFDPIVVLPAHGPLEERFRGSKTEVLVLNLPVLRRSLFNPGGLGKFVFSFLGSIIRLTRLIKIRRVDLVHTNTSAVWGGGISARLAGKPHVHSVMELVEDPLFVAKAMAVMTSAFSDKVIAVSEAVKGHFLKLAPWGSERYIVLPTPVNMEIYRFSDEGRRRVRSEIGVSEDTVVVGMAARLNRWKGQDVFVEACARALELAGNTKKMHFIILGDPLPGEEHFELEMQARIDELNIRSFVTTRSYQQNFNEWLSAMDVYVLPSKWPEPNSSGVIAAMAVGLPVVGTNIGGTPEVIIPGETGMLVPPDDPEAMARAIVELVESDSNRLSMGKKARERARSLYSMDTYAAKVMEIYDELTG